MKEIFVIKKSTGKYYAGADWRPVFSANQEDADIFRSYEEALKFLEKVSVWDEYGGTWFPDGLYKIEQWFAVEGNND
jgi:hypothetical protein